MSKDPISVSPALSFRSASIDDRAMLKIIVLRNALFPFASLPGCCPLPPCASSGRSSNIISKIRPFSGSAPVHSGAGTLMPGSRSSAHASIFLDSFNIQFLIGYWFARIPVGRYRSAPRPGWNPFPERRISDSQHLVEPYSTIDQNRQVKCAVI